MVVKVLDNSRFFCYFAKNLAHYSLFYHGKETK